LERRAWSHRTERILNFIFEISLFRVIRVIRG
jgi:hypothetical protein